MRTTAGWIILGIAAVSVGGCSASEPTPTGAPTEVRGVSMTPELDEESGAVVLPADRFIPNELERDRINSAVSALVSSCAAESGVTFVPAEPIDDPIYLSESYFGPWTLAQARKFAFVTPLSDADLIANGILTDDGQPGSGPDGSEQGGDGGVSLNADLSEADWAVMESCEETVKSENVLDDALLLNGPWIQELADVDEGLPQDESVQAAAADVKACLESRGRSTQADTPWLPLGVDGQTITEAQIALAVDVVECKEDSDFTRRVATAHAARQAVVIEEYADELMAYRDDVTAALAEADELFGESATAADRTPGS